MAVVWLADATPQIFAYQKNPVGQFIVGTNFVVLLFDMGKLFRLLAAPIPSVGLLATASQGAVSWWVSCCSCSRALYWRAGD